MKKALLLLALLLPGFLGASELDRRLADLEDFTRALELVEQKSLGPTEHGQLINQAISGLLEGQDPYSGLLTQSEYDQLKALSAGRQWGVGLSLQPKEGKLLVVRVYPGTSAAKAGIKRGDMIDQLAGKEVERMGPKGLRALERSRKDLEVQLVTGKRFGLKKGWFDQPGLVVRPLEPGLLLIEIQEFFVGTPKLVEQALLKHRPKRVILDLRDNPGGLVFSAVEIAELFVGPGPIAETRDKQGERLEVFTAKKPPLLPLQSTVVLINRHSASASELLAQTLSERGVAQLVGERSFGKGVVQGMFPIGKKRYALLTIARYYGPSGISFHQKGIEPKVAVADRWASKRWGKGDLIYQRGLALVKR